MTCMVSRTESISTRIEYMYFIGIIWKPVCCMNKFFQNLADITFFPLHNNYKNITKACVQAFRWNWATIYQLTAAEMLTFLLCLNISEQFVCNKLDGMAWTRFLAGALGSFVHHIRHPTHLIQQTELPDLTFSQHCLWHVTVLWDVMTSSLVQ